MKRAQNGLFITPIVWGVWNSFYALRMAWKYGSALHAHESSRRRIKKSLRWALLAAFKPRFSVEWFNWVRKPELQPFLEVNAYLALRPLHAYLSTRWNCRGRFKVIRDTYDLVLNHGGAVRQALLNPEGIVLARLEMPRLGLIEFGMCSDYGFRREGEFALAMRTQGPPDYLMALAFGMERTGNDQWTCYIGAIQGRGGLEIMRETTKAMHGMRPRCLMVFLVQEVARALGAESVLGASNAIHVSRKKHLVHLPFRHAIPFDYDAFWTEYGAVHDSQGWFHLPTLLTRRSCCAIKPNKRSMYTNRYRMLDELAEQIRRSMGAGSVIDCMSWNAAS